MADKGDDASELLELALDGTTDVETRLKIMAYRLVTVVREKENLELRVAKMEKSFNMGAGILLVLPVMGAAVGMFLAFGKAIFKPWTN